MPWVAAAVGAGIAIYGAVKSANDQADRDEEEAKIARAQAAELERREKMNEQLTDVSAVEQMHKFASSYAMSGSAGTGIGGQLEIMRQAKQQELVSAEQARYQESVLGQQANVYSDLANSTRDAGIINGLGAGISGAATAASLYYQQHPTIPPKQGLPQQTSGG